MTVDVVVFGRCTWDEWVTEWPVDSDDGFGGSGANVAITLAQLGLDVRLVSELGVDGHSRRYLQRLESSSIDTSLIDTQEGRISVCEIEPGVRYRWLNGRPTVEQPTAERVAQALDNGRCAVFTDTQAPQSSLTARVFWLPQLWLNEAPRAVNLSHIEYVLLNRRERSQVERLYGVSVSELSSREHHATFVCTNEADDTVTYHRGASTRYPVPYQEPRVAIGGGDAFAAGCIFGSVTGRGLGWGIALGQLLAAAVVRQVGCQLHEETTRNLLRVHIERGLNRGA